MPTWQTRIYHATHHVMYLLFFAVPLIGWAYSSAAGFPIVLFGVLPLPDLLAVDKEFAKQIKELQACRQSVIFTTCTKQAADNSIILINGI